MFDIYSANEWSTKKRKDFLCDQLKNWPSLFNFLNQKDFCCMPLPNIYPTMNYDPTEGGLFFYSLEVARTLQNLTTHMSLTWKREESPLLIGLSVKRGEHGMEVYVPTPITLLKIADTEIPYSKASKEQQAAYDAGNLEGRKIIHFKVGYTFDIAQTNFPPEHYPKFLDRGIPSELHKQCTEVLKEFCEETLGVRVFLQDQDQEIKGAALYGFHSPGTSEIHIASTLQDTAAFSTLTHEVGHALAHGTLDEFFNIGSHQKEFEADVMSIMLQQHYGLEITDERKSHLVGHYKSWLESDPKNFAPDKSIKKMFDLYSSQVKLLDQKMIQKFPELAQKLLAPEIEPNPEAKLQKQITRKSIPKKKKTLRR